MKRTYLYSALIALGVTALTLSIYSVFQSNTESTIKIEHINSTPGAKAMFTVDKEGKVVPLDFTKVAEDVMGSVVHIKSTKAYADRTDPQFRQSPDPFDDLFKDGPFRDFFFRPQTFPIKTGGRCRVLDREAG
jgi:serine protease Do